MQPFRVHSGIVAPLDRANVDTDAIIPKQFLKSIKRSGFGVEPVRRVALHSITASPAWTTRRGIRIRISC